MNQNLVRRKITPRGMPPSVEQGVRALGRVGGRPSSVFGSTKHMDRIIVPESHLEQIVGRIADLDPRVISVACQPFTLCLRTGEMSYTRGNRVGARTRRLKSMTLMQKYTPDLLVVTETGEQLVVEVKHPRFPGDSEYQEKLEIAKQILLSKGYEFIVITVVSTEDSPMIQNVHLLASYSVCFGKQYAEQSTLVQLGDVERGPERLDRICTRLGIDIRHSPSLLLSGRYATDLTKQRLSAETLLAPALGSLVHLQLLPTTTGIL